MHLYLLRHGESMGNATGDYSTDTHDSLSDLGLQQAEKLVPRLSELGIGRIYCSPLKRAVQTILPYAESAGHRVEIWPELAEACWQEDRTVHDGTGFDLEECSDYTDLSDSIHFRDNQAMRPVGGETYSQGIHRLRTASQMLTDRHQGSRDKVLVVAHGYANSRLIEFFLGLEPVGRFDHDNTGLTYMVKESDGFKVRYLNRNH